MRLSIESFDPLLRSLHSEHAVLARLGLFVRLVALEEELCTLPQNPRKLDFLQQVGFLV